MKDILAIKILLLENRKRLNQYLKTLPNIKFQQDFIPEEAFE